MSKRFPALALALGAAVLAAGCQPSPEQLAANSKATIDRYCLDCHDYAGRTAGLTLENADLVHVANRADTWEKVIVKLRGHLMPPPGGPRPDAAATDSLVAYLEKSLDAAAAAHPDPGPAAIHRLNRTEYGNAIRDLLALDINPEDFLPADDEGYGFDNIADILRVSPSLLEQYLDGSAKIAALAVGDPNTRPVSTVHRAPPDLSQREHIEGLPLGTRGGMLIKYNFPLDGEYDFRVFLLRNIVGYMTGLEWPHELEIAIDGNRVFSAGVGGPEDNKMSDANFAAAANAIDARLHTRIPVSAGPHDVSIAFVRKSAAETQEPLELFTRDLDLQDMNGIPVVDYATITGPLNPTGPGDTPSRRKIFTCHPGERSEELPCAEDILSTLAHRAYRRPVSEQDIALLMKAFREGRERGSFDQGIETALRLVLTSPAFLFRSESDPPGLAPGTVYPLGDVALASRLSFFLWSSIPDDELLGLAEQGKLSDPKVYHAQVARMLADPRANSLVDDFAAQWLYLRNLKSARPDVEEFPDFDENLREAMGTETKMLFEHVMRANLNVMELLTAKYTFVNERLAKHYGIPNVYGSNFRRVELTDPNRYGLLGQASILTVTSLPNRTSPVLRGKFIMTNLLGTPPPAPPPKVPPFPENEPGKAPRSVRERLKSHRVNPVCATCHDVLDPIGLSLENFDAVGRWRTKEAGGIVDSSGQLADGTPVNGVVSLRNALTAKPEQFVRVLTEKLLTYALGRGLEAYDMPTVRGIVDAAGKDDYRFADIINGIVDSTPFRMKKVAPVANPATTTAKLDD